MTMDSLLYFHLIRLSIEVFCDVNRAGIGSTLFCRYLCGLTETDPVLQKMVFGLRDPLPSLLLLLAPDRPPEAPGALIT